MTRRTILGTFCALILGVSPAMAGNVSHDELFDGLFYSSDVHFSDSDESLTLPLIGDQEDGLIGFYVVPNAAPKHLEEYLAQELNTISPAAGVRFTLGFSL